MSLPTSGIHNVDQPSRSSMFTQSSQAPGLQPGLQLMGMQGMTSLGHPGHPFVLGSQSGMMHLPHGVMATAAEAMAIASTTATNSRLGPMGDQASLRVSFVFMSVYNVYTSGIKQKVYAYLISG